MDELMSMSMGKGFGVCLIAIAAATACGSGEEGASELSDGGAETGGVGDGVAGSQREGIGGRGTGGIALMTGGTDDGVAGTNAGGACVEATARTTLRKVRLAFLFDVSGSMGELDYAWHDPVLKWDPVVAATQSFFTDPASTGLEVSLTFFPQGDEDVKCEAETYEEPDVPFVELPTTTLGDAIDAIPHESPDDWGDGTPTLAIIRGAITALEESMAAAPDTIHAIVLVTDGYPAGCGGDNDIASIVDVVESVRDSMATYVIGVRNPDIEGAPETVNDLDAIAVGGGTAHAYLIDTGNPEATSSSLQAAVNEIRSESLSCDLEIPPPPAGSELDPRRVKVTYTSDATPIALGYDPDCAGDNSWHYDDPEAPTMIHLCPNTCTAVQSDRSAELDVAFACEDVIPELH